MSMRNQIFDHTLVRAIANKVSIDVKDRLVVFIHIPKCAGRTLSSILDTRFVATRRPEDTGCWVQGTIFEQFLGEGKENTLENLATVDRNSTYLRGHLPVGAFEDFKRTPAYVTFLRDPRAQAMSHYRFGIERGGWENGTKVSDLIELGHMIDNPQTRQIAGLQNRNEACNEQTLDRAISNIRDFLFVGKVENFELDLMTLLSKLGGPGFIYQNHGRGKNLSIAPNIVSELEAMNKLDQKLYETAPIHAPLTGEIHTQLAVDSTLLRPKEGPVLVIDDSDLSPIRQIIEDKGGRLIEWPVPNGNANS